jgi:hypothetical protein
MTGNTDMKKIDQLRIKVVNSAIADYSTRKEHRQSNEWVLLDQTIEELLRFIESNKIMYGKGEYDKYLEQSIWTGYDYRATRTTCKICHKWWEREHDSDGSLFEAREHIRIGNHKSKPFKFDGCAR